MRDDTSPRLLDNRLCLAVAFLMLLFPEGSRADTWVALRQSMVIEVLEMADDYRSPIQRSEFTDAVLKAMSTVPRHKFVPLTQMPFSYTNRPLPIGYGQTISQPYIVALMTDLLKVTSDSTVLEVGTGSGYQAAILSKLVQTVYSIEIIEKLAQQAKKRIKKLGYHNVHTIVGDGYFGWAKHAPYDAIIVTAVAGQIPPSLLEQLKPKGRMVIPVGTPFSSQYLMLVTKDAQGRIQTQQLLPVRFVPLTGKH